MTTTEFQVETPTGTIAYTTSDVDLARRYVRQNADRPLVIYEIIQTTVRRRVSVRQLRAVA